jgi:ATP-dependent Clp protease protease subunit
VGYHCWRGLVAADVAVLWWQIDDFVADTIISQLLLLDANNPKKDIRLFINCSGGSLNAAMAIYDAVQLVRADVSTIALGIAASTAAIVLAGEQPRGTVSPLHLSL